MTDEDNKFYRQKRAEVSRVISYIPHPSSDRSPDRLRRLSRSTPSDFLNFP